MPKTRFVVIEGADGTGKSTLVKQLVSQNPRFKEFNFRWDETRRLPMDAEEKIPMLLKAFEHFDSDYVYVIDRFLLTDIVYNDVIRKEDVTLWQKRLDEFRSRFDVLYVVLGRNPVMEDWQDNKIHITRNDFNQIIHEFIAHSNYSTTKLWYRKLSEGGVIKAELSRALVNELDTLYFSEQLLQEQNSWDLWRFFLCCIALNNTNGWTARKVMGQFFYWFDEPEKVGSGHTLRIERLLEPLGLQKMRTKHFLAVSEAFTQKPRHKGYLMSRNEIMEIPGLGKYAADSYELLVSKNKSFVPTEPFDKELKKVYENSINA